MPLPLDLRSSSPKRQREANPTAAFAVFGLLALMMLGLFTYLARTDRQPPELPPPSSLEQTKQ
jgi:hypothetical protein